VDPDLSRDGGWFTCSTNQKSCPAGYACDETNKICVKTGASKDISPSLDQKSKADSKKPTDGKTKVDQKIIADGKGQPD